MFRVWSRQPAQSWKSFIAGAKNGYAREDVMTLVVMIIFFCNIYSRLGAHSFS
jgi:hypothetical protein